MGRPEGPGCYCAANNIIRKYTDRLSEKYPYVVIDNEAGMEHLSRRTTHTVDTLLIISDPSQKGILTAKRINSLVDELRLEVQRRVLIINRIPQIGLDNFMDSIKDLPFESIYAVPEDDKIYSFDLEGKPVFELPADSKALVSVFNLLDSLKIP